MNYKIREATTVVSYGMRVLMARQVWMPRPGALLTSMRFDSSLSTKYKLNNYE